MPDKEKNRYIEVDNLQLKYTICFCRRGNLVLMIYRENEPNKNLWNGLGGKIELEESPLTSVKREMIEEADIDLDQARNIHYAGIVTWNQEGAEGKSLGMYAFMVDFPDNWPIWKGDKVTPEGALSWKSAEWACDLYNTGVVENIPHFLPPMLRKEPPRDYHFEYQGRQLTHILTRDIPPSILKLEKQ